MWPSGTLPDEFDRIVRFVVKLAPDSGPGVRREDRLRLGHLALRENLPGHRRTDQAALRVDVAEDPVSALKRLEDDVQDLLVHLLVADGQKDIGDPVVDRQFPVRTGQLRFRVLAHLDLGFQDHSLRRSAPPAS